MLRQPDQRNVGPAGRPLWARVEQGCPDRQAGGHPPGASRLPRGTPSWSAGISSRRPGGGSCLLRMAPQGAGAADDAVWCGATQGRQGTGLGHEGARGSKCEQAASAALPLLPGLGLHRIPSGQPGPHQGAGHLLPLLLKQRERSCSERGMLEGGRRLGRGGPWCAAPQQALQLWQGSL